MSWDTGPAAGATAGSLGPVASGTTYSVDLSSTVRADGPLSLRVATTSADGAPYYAKEGSSNQTPKLMVTCA